MKIAVFGTRNLQDPKEVITKIVKYLIDNKIDVSEVRSGNAIGTDQLANKFAKIDKLKVCHFLPWESYNKDLQMSKNNVYYICKISKKFDKDILKLFPFMEKTKPGMWSLIRRNFQIIMGENGDDYVDMVFWHTADGELTGGTRYGVMLARKLGIKDINI